MATTAEAVLPPGDVVTPKVATRRQHHSVRQRTDSCKIRTGDNTFRYVAVSTGPLLPAFTPPRPRIYRPTYATACGRRMTSDHSERRAGRRRSIGGIEYQVDNGLRKQPVRFGPAQARLAFQGNQIRCLADDALTGVA